MIIELDLEISEPARINKVEEINKLGIKAIYQNKKVYITIKSFTYSDAMGLTLPTKKTFYYIPSIIIDNIKIRKWRI